MDSGVVASGQNVENSGPKSGPNNNISSCGSDLNNNNGESESNIPKFSLNLIANTTNTNNNHTNVNNNRSCSSSSTSSRSNVSTGGSSSNIGGVIANTENFASISNVTKDDANNNNTPGDFVGEFESVLDNNNNSNNIISNIKVEDALPPAAAVAAPAAPQSEVAQDSLSMPIPIFNFDIDVRTEATAPATAAASEAQGAQAALGYISPFTADSVKRAEDYARAPMTNHNLSIESFGLEKQVRSCKKYHFANETLIRVDLADSQGNIVRSIIPPSMTLEAIGSKLVRTLILTGDDMKYSIKEVKVQSEEASVDLSMSSKKHKSKKNEFKAKGHAGRSRSGRGSKNSAKTRKSGKNNSNNNNNNNSKKSNKSNKSKQNNNNNNTINNNNQFNQVLGRKYTDDETAFLNQEMEAFTFPLYGSAKHLDEKEKYTLQDWNINEIDLWVKAEHVENVAIRQYIKFYPNIRPNLWIILQICKKSLPSGYGWRWRSPISRLKKHYDALKQSLLLQGTPIGKNNTIPKNCLIEDRLLNACINFDDLRTRYNVWQLSDGKKHNKNGNVAKSRRISGNGRASSNNNSLNLPSYVLTVVSVL